jgi:hypothetical protein
MAGQTVNFSITMILPDGIQRVECPEPACGELAELSKGFPWGSSLFLVDQ